MSFMCFLLLLLVFLCDCNCVDSVFRRKGIVRCLLKLVNKSNNNTRNSYDNSDSYDHSIDTKNHLVVLSSKEIVTLPAMNSNSSINSNSNSNSSGNSNSYSYSDSGGNSTSNSTSNSALNSNQESDMTNLLPTTINNSNTVTNRTTKLHLFGTNYKNSKQIVKLVVYFLLMYFFTIVYNVSNKKVLNELPIPITIATIQLFLGKSY